MERKVKTVDYKTVTEKVGDKWDRTETIVTIVDDPNDFETSKAKDTPSLWEQTFGPKAGR